MKKEIKFNLSEADKNLFLKMRYSYVSDAERIFFEKIRYKEQYESAFSNELLVYEMENKDHIYLVRRFYDVYLIGHAFSNGESSEYECETLADALMVQLDECVGFFEHITLMEWLRKYDYSVVKYNRNYDED